MGDGERAALAVRKPAPGVGLDRFEVVEIRHDVLRRCALRALHQAALHLGEGITGADGDGGRAQAGEPIAQTRTQRFAHRLARGQDQPAADQIHTAAGLVEKPADEAGTPQGTVGRKGADRRQRLRQRIADLELGIGRAGQSVNHRQARDHGGANDAQESTGRKAARADKGSPRDRSPPVLPHRCSGAPGPRWHRHHARCCRTATVVRWWSRWYR